MIKSLLIANRGEIAVRVIQTAKRMGIRTIAVASEADRNALHAQLADACVPLGPSEPSESYLKMDAIVSAANEAGAQAVHPGYGFLSERAEFVEACTQAGLLFVGPSAEAMRLLGSKSRAKSLAVQADVPVVPGLFDPEATSKELEDAAGRIGYPVLLKASAGGGGRGMRIVRAPNDFSDALRLASEEALRAFGDGSMMVEKCVERPRHVEVQLLADGHGNAAVLFERECSLQRRHQKLVEEAPSPYAELWPEMRSAALRLAKAAGYSNAGTVEFLVDEAAKSFYFLEVNARLQVEHPVTEQITGLDLVEWQLRIASGEKLNLPANILEGRRDAICGHAIEVRILAEDASNGFLPSTGTLHAFVAPRLPGVRVDAGFRAGDEVSRYYDSLLAKLIVHACDRPTAIARLKQALEDFHVLGPKTNIGFLRDLVDSPEVLRGDYDTGWVERVFHETNGPCPPEIGAIAATAASKQVGSQGGPGSVWDLSDGFRNVRTGR